MIRRTFHVKTQLPTRISNFEAEEGFGLKLCQATCALRTKCTRNFGLQAEQETKLEFTCVLEAVDAHDYETLKQMAVSSQEN